MTSRTYKKAGFSRGSTRDGGDIGSSPINFDRAIYLADVRDLRQNEDDQPSLAGLLTFLKTVMFPPLEVTRSTSLQLIRNMLMLRLLKRQLVVQNPPDIPSSLPPELQDFLKKVPYH